MEALNQLWSIADEESSKFKGDPALVFEAIGLILIRPLENYGYQSTPINSSAFAHTGGDGVHFSLVHLDGMVLEASPVVMTVPMQFDQSNLIVGSNLFEFLCLGERTGYFCLEQLVYDRSRASDLLLNPVSVDVRALDDQDEKIYRRWLYLLQILRSSFNLKSWNNVEQRLNELHDQYFSQLVFNSKYRNPK